MSKFIQWNECADRHFYDSGTVIAGVDEVGRGCLAGPVYAAAVSLNYSKLQSLSSHQLELVRDSKTLSSLQRKKAVSIIEQIAREFKISWASVEEIETIGILKSTHLAMNRALQQSLLPIEHVLVDGNQRIPTCNIPQTTLVGGDSKSFAIAAASILAKEARDSYMQQISNLYPQYGFEKHVGYGTKFHIDQIKAHGITAIHRKTFAPISQFAMTSPQL